MAYRWTPEDIWKVLKSADWYENQWNFIIQFEMPGFSIDQLNGVYRRYGKDWTPPEGTKEPTLKAETSPSQIANEINTFIATHQSNAVLPAKLSPHLTTEESVSSSLPELNANLKNRVLRLIKGKKQTLVDLANALNVAPKTVQAILAELKQEHYLIEDDPENIGQYHLSPEASDSTYEIDSSDYFGNEIKFGLISDTHLGSRWERLDVANALYDIFEKEKITKVFHAGNIIEGDSYFNKFDVRVHGVEQQLNYCVEKYPQRNGITTRFITGACHEGWWIAREGIDIGKRLEHTAQEAGREDLIYMGHVEADIRLKAKNGEAVMRILHPGGGAPYAISYPIQKIVESYQGNEKPHILFIGHHHKAGYFYPREVHCVMAACCQDQSTFLRKLKIQVHLGGFIIRFNQADTGEINRFRAEYIPFYDRTFYEDKYSVSK